MPTATEELPTFFQTHNLRSADFQTCLALIRTWHPDARIQPVSNQGGCSYTTIVQRCSRDGTTSGGEGGRDASIVQFRLRKHALNVQMAREARAVYGDLVPDLLRHVSVILGRWDQHCAVQACEMAFVPGVSLASLQVRRHHLVKGESQKLRRVMIGMARFFAMGWDEAVNSGRNLEASCTGKVGSSILSRLSALEQKLPSAYLRREARVARAKVRAGALDLLPVALSHGDLLSSNVMVDASTWEIRGLVDWAEAEYLPFGMTLGGLEAFLGYMRYDHGKATSDGGGGGGGVTAAFRYYQTADEMRSLFWEVLDDAIPALRSDRAIREAVRLSCRIGILLWHGFAWDDGSIDRVIDKVNDFEELAYLEAFLAPHNNAKVSRL